MPVLLTGAPGLSGQFGDKEAHGLVMTAATAGQRALCAGDKSRDRRIDDAMKQSVAGAGDEVGSFGGTKHAEDERNKGGSGWCGFWAFESHRGGNTG